MLQQVTVDRDLLSRALDVVQFLTFLMVGGIARMLWALRETSAKHNRALYGEDGKNGLVGQSKKAHALRNIIQKLVYEVGTIRRESATDEERREIDRRRDDDYEKDFAELSGA